MVDSEDVVTPRQCLHGQPVQEVQEVSLPPQAQADSEAVFAAALAIAAVGSEEASVAAIAEDLEEAEEVLAIKVEEGSVAVEAVMVMAQHPLLMLLLDLAGTVVVSAQVGMVDLQSTAALTAQLLLRRQ